ncbi:MAG: hypothetical protein V7655_11885 [Aequorivita antarctica]
MKLSKLLEPFQALRNRLFAKLYLAQTISLLGDAFTLLAKTKNSEDEGGH